VICDGTADPQEQGAMIYLHSFTAALGTITVIGILWLWWRYGSLNWAGVVGLCFSAFAMVMGWGALIFVHRIFG
jgi:hypothetical protein